MTPKQALQLWDLLCCRPKAFEKTLPLFAGWQWNRQIPNVETLYNPEHYDAVRYAISFLRSWANLMEIGLREQEAAHRQNDKKWLAAHADDGEEKPKKGRKKGGKVSVDSLFGESNDEAVSTTQELQEASN